MEKSMESLPSPSFLIKSPWGLVFATALIVRAFSIYALATCVRSNRVMPDLLMFGPPHINPPPVTSLNQLFGSMMLRFHFTAASHPYSAYCFIVNTFWKIYKHFLSNDFPLHLLKTFCTYIWARTYFSTFKMSPKRYPKRTFDPSYIFMS